MRQLSRKLASIFFRDRAEAELDAEMRFHLEKLTELNIERGMSPKEARRNALLEFGGLDKTKEQCRDVRSFNLVENVFQDLHYGFRQLRRSPGFTVAAVLTLALGIGANTAIFSLLNAALLRPLPGVRDPGELVAFYRSQNGNAYDNFGYPDYVDYRTRNQSFAGLAAFCPTPLSFSNGSPERLRANVVTGNYFPLLGVKAEAGRLIDSDQERPGANPVVVISYGLWQRAFGMKPDVIGKRVSLNGDDFTIIGVADRRFTGTETGLSIDAWVPMSMLQQAIPRFTGRNPLTERAWGWLEVFGRLRPGIRFESAEAEINTIGRQLEQSYPSTNSGRSAELVRGLGLYPDDRTDLSGLLGLLLGAVGLLLLIACANVAGLFLERATGRRREIAVRLAIGAGRNRILRQLVTEGLMLAGVGGGVGLLVAPWAAGITGSWVQSSGVLSQLDAGLDMRVLLFTLLVSISTGIAFAIIPALSVSKPDLVDSLKEGSPGSGTRSRLQRLLVTAQVALSFVLLIGAALLLSTFRRIVTADPGFRTGNLILMSMDLSIQGYTTERGKQFYRQLLQKVQSLPGVDSATLAKTMPPDDWTDRVSVFHPGEEPPQDVLRGREFELGIRVDADPVGPNFFRTLSIPLLEGRAFTEADDSRAPGVAIINQRLAKRLWPGKDAIGQRISWPTLLGPPRPPLEVVGVAADSRYGSLIGDVPLLIYYPVLQEYDGRATLAVETASGSSDVIPAIRRQLAELDKSLPVYRVRTMREHIAASLWQQRMAAGLISIFGLLALVLATIGLYSVAANSVARRVREIGIRMALGADAKQVLKLVVVEGLLLSVAGVLVGLVIAPLVTRSIAGFVPGVIGASVSSYVAAALLLVLVTVAASLAPARRAARLNPVDALRSE